MKKLISILLAIVICAALAACNGTNGTEKATTVHTPMATKTSPDKYTYYLKDYVGRNCASFGFGWGSQIGEKYGSGTIYFNIITNDGSYVDVNDKNSLSQYIVTGQSVEPNTEIKYVFKVSSDGEELRLIDTQSLEEVDLYVSRISNEITSFTSENESEKKLTTTSETTITTTTVTTAELEEKADTDSTKPQKNAFNENTAKKVVAGNYEIPVPDYWEEDTPDAGNVDYRGYAEKGAKIVMLMINSQTDTIDPATFDVLYDDKDNMVEMLTENLSDSFGGCEFTGCDIYETDELKGMTFDFSFTYDEYGMECKTRWVVFPSEKDNKWIYISLVSSNYANYSYDEDFMKMINAIKKRTNAAAETSATVSKGIRPEFKEAMDSYEAFYDEYCDIMKKYMENPTDLTIFSQYSECLEKAEEFDEKIDAIDEDSLTPEEDAYYLEVTGRVLAKMLEIYQ